MTPVEGASQTALLELAGVIDGNTAPTFESTLSDLRSKGILRLVLDLARIKYVNSTGLGALVKHADTFTQAGGGVALVRIPSKVRIIVELSGLIQLLNICADVDTALRKLGADVVPGAMPAGTRVNARPASGVAAAGRTPSSTGAGSTGMWRNAAARLAAEDPELALQKCKTSLERVLRHLHRTYVGDDTGIGMNDLVNGLKSKRILPPKVLVLIYAVWELAKSAGQPLYGSDEAINHEAYIAVASMTILQRWFRETHPQ